jgi:hypothetical protein
MEKNEENSKLKFYLNRLLVDRIADTYHRGILMDKTIALAKDAFKLINSNLTNFVKNHEIWVYKTILNHFVQIYLETEASKPGQFAWLIATNIPAEFAQELAFQIRSGIDIRGKNLQKILNDHQERNRKMRKEAESRIFNISDRVLFTTMDKTHAVVKIKTQTDLLHIGQYLGHCYGDEIDLKFFYNRVRNGTYEMFTVFNIEKGLDNAKPLCTFTYDRPSLTIDEIKIRDNKKLNFGHKYFTQVITSIVAIRKLISEKSKIPESVIKIDRATLDADRSHARDSFLITNTGEIAFVINKSVAEFKKLNIRYQDILILPALNFKNQKQLYWLRKYGYTAY